MDWNTMEMAPKNGAPFLATDGRLLAVFYWELPSSGNARFWQIGCTAYDHDAEYADYDGPCFFEPTHWMPLPAAPQ